MPDNNIPKNPPPLSKFNQPNPQLIKTTSPSKKPPNKMLIFLTISLLIITAILFTPAPYFQQNQWRLAPPLYKSLLAFFLQVDQPSPTPEPTPYNPPPSPAPSPTSDPTANWKSHTNQELGLSFKYPNTWDTTIKESIHSTMSELTLDPYLTIEIGVRYNQDEQRELSYLETLKSIAPESTPSALTVDGREAAYIKIESSNLVAIDLGRNIALIQYQLSPNQQLQETDQVQFLQFLSAIKFSSPSPSNNPTN